VAGWPGNQAALLLTRNWKWPAAGYDDLAGRRCFRAPLDRIRDEERRLDDWQARLTRAMETRLSQASQKTGSHGRTTRFLSPLNVLARGYSLTRRDGDRLVIRSAGEVCVGELLRTAVQEGQIISRVESTSIERSLPGTSQEIAPVSLRGLASPYTDRLS